MTVSFDFDGTLTENRMQALAKSFIDAGVKVVITTSRPYEKASAMEILELANKLGIPKSNINFTAYQYKATHLKDVDLHIDNDSLEVDAINYDSGKCLALLYNQVKIRQTL